uniref:putative glycosyltransferase 6 domain-containing protein 1 n=1 Tax=Jaculus jaculus TaxID=51337 RepID=UPI001E1B3B13|nr:putative glycosyltransferase 6 domain-containing protein 1 [Jaculus jaculus]
MGSVMIVPLCSRNHQAQELQLSDWFKPRRRPDVITITNWLAPIIWEKTFHRQALEKYYRKRNITVGLAVFAAGRLVDEHLELFLRSAKKYFMPGHRVVFYIMVDTYPQLPYIQSSPLRSFQVLVMGRERWWIDLDLMRMKTLAEHIVDHIQNEVDFLFSMTANLVFQNEFGVETLGASVAQLHARWYFQNPKYFPYERRPKSAAYIPFGKGDFYYGGSTIGGTPRRILDFIQNYLKGILHDMRSGLNSSYEKYLNKYFFLNKPTKLLSPEYNWNPMFISPKQVRYMKVALYPPETS